MIVATSVVAGCDMQAPINASDDTKSLGLRASKAHDWEPTEKEPVALEIDAAHTVKRGGQLPVRIRVHNGSTRPIVIGLGQQHGFDLVIAMAGLRADSGAVWSPYKGDMGIGRDATITDPLRPGADTTFEAVWLTQDDDGRSVPAGRYRLRAAVAAELLSTRQIWTPWVPVEVTP